MKMKYNTRIIAHRGYSGKYPENTMLAFKKALEVGAEGIELDVHLTSDEEVIICHDENIRRTSEGEGEICQMTLEEIKKFRFLNNMDVEYSNDDEIKAPTLEEFMEWFKDTSIIVNIEIKNNIYKYPGLVKKVIDICNGYNVKERVIISSFNHHSIEEVKTIDKEYICGFLTASSILTPGNYTKEHGAECYHPLFISLYPEDIENLKENKVMINTWTVNEEEHIKDLINLDIDGIITNYPEKALKIREELNK